MILKIALRETISKRIMVCLLSYMENSGLLSDQVFGRDSRAVRDAHLASIIKSSDDAIVSKDLQGTIQTWNPAAERIFGYTAQEAIGKTMHLIIPEDRHQEEDMILARIRRGERIDHFETIRRRKNGELIEVSVTISPIRDEYGNIIGASKIARDLSDRALNETLVNRLGAIVESSDDAIISKNLDGIIQSWNRGAERHFGYMAEEVIGKPITILLPPDRLDEESRILDRIRRGERVDHFETVRIRKDGSEVNVSVTISPIRDRSGRVLGASKVARDITQKKVFEATASALAQDLEKRVRDRTEELETANRELESFTYSIAHDLRGPLRAIIANSIMLKADYAGKIDEDGIQMLDRQTVAAKRLAQLIEDLLRYARLGKAAIKADDLDFSALAQGVVHDIRDCRCTFSVQPDMKAYGDKNLLLLLLHNLVDNACKFSPNGGAVSIGKVSNTYFVKDHGLGFDMAYAEKIFIPFERLVRNDEISGTGIGLANVKRIVERHGGTIWANSVLGSGTTFYFTLGESH